MSRAHPKTTLAERRAKVARMRNMRMTYRDIATSLGVSVSTVKNDASVMLKEWRESQAEAVNEMVERELVELDEIEELAAKEFARQPPGKRSVRWLEMRVKAKQARAKLLGLEDARSAMEAAAEAKQAAETLGEALRSVEDFSPSELADAYHAIANNKK